MKPSPVFTGLEEDLDWSDGESVSLARERQIEALQKDGNVLKGKSQVDNKTEHSKLAKAKLDEYAAKKWEAKHGAHSYDAVAQAEDYDLAKTSDSTRAKLVNAWEEAKAKPSTRTANASEAEYNKFVQAKLDEYRVKRAAILDEEAKLKAEAKQKMQSSKAKKS